MDDVTLFLPNLDGGGAQKVLVSLANEFSRRGVDVTLVVADSDGPYYSKVSESVTIYDLESSRALTSFIRLVSYFNSCDPSAVLSTLTYFNVLVAAAHFISGSDSRLVLRETTHPTASRVRRTSWKDHMISLFAEWAYGYASSVVAISKQVADSVSKIRNIPVSKINVLYNPVNTEGIRTSLEGQRLGKQIDSSFLLSVGRLVYDKDFDCVLHAYYQIQKVRDIDLAIIGEGPQRDNLEALASDLGIRQNVYMPGYVDDPYPYMDESRLLVLASRWEGFGNVLIEAMATGTPVVATNCPGGPSEILGDGRWGHLVPVGEPTALAQAIIRTLDEPPAPPVELRQRAKRYDIKRISTEYLNVLSQ